MATTKSAARERLNRARVVACAVNMADENGLEALSMRSLASELGFGVMSLYNHVSDKDDLIEGMSDAVAAEIELPSGPVVWKRDLRALAISAYRALLNHPWASSVWGRSNSLNKSKYHEAVLRVLRQAGFSEELSCRGFHALTMHVVGFAMQVMEMQFTSKAELHALGKKYMADLPREDYPYLHEHVEFHLAGKDTRNDFKYMLDLILDGLERDKSSG